MRRAGLLSGVAAVLGMAALAPGVADISQMRELNSVRSASAEQGKTTPNKAVKNELRAILGGGGFGSWGGKQRRAGYGWTNRHAQRVARKKRNQARHRAAGKGGR